MELENVTKTGTTTLGIVCKEGVVIATETRATMGTLIAHKDQVDRVAALFSE